MIQVTNLSQTLNGSQILHDLNFTIEDGAFVALTGKSGSGKTTLLYAISSLEQPTQGQVLIDGQDLYGLSDKAIHQFRNHSLGFVFQSHYLLPELSAFENVMMPVRYRSNIAEYEAFAKEVLSDFELKEHWHKKPANLSGGQQQRVAVARAVVNRPRYLFADEPTGALDSKNSQTVIEMFQKINQKVGTTIIIVTHDSDFAALADRQIELFDGRIVNIP